MNRINLVLIYVITFSNLFAFDKTNQNNGNDFTKDSLTTKQYLDDLNELFEILGSVDSFHKVNDRLKDQNFNGQKMIYRERVKKIRSNAEFYLVVREIINSIQDPHATIIKAPDNWSRNTLNEVHHRYADSSNFYYKRIHSNHISSKIIRVSLPIAYIEGSYKVYYPFLIDDIEIDSGSIVTKINGQNIHEVVRENYMQIPHIKYDIQRSRLFYDNFYRYGAFMDSTQFMLSFEGDQHEIQVDLLSDPDVEIDRKPKKLIWSGDMGYKNVLYLEDQKVLYIRMPAMADAIFYENEIMKYSGNDIEKVVVDIRGNPGGQDFPWMMVLRKIVPSNTSLNRPIKVGFQNKNEEMKRYLETILHEGWYDSSFAKQEIKSIPEIGGEYVTFESINQVFTNPDSVTLSYEGNIFILTDGFYYSSAGNFVAMAQYNDNIISLGMPNGFFSGTQFTPMEFMLANSKIMFRIEPSIDYTEVKEMEDYYHNYIDIPYQYTTKDFYNLSLLDGDVSSIDYLLNVDPLMKAVFRYE
ncbi:MAG: S41 family peptidase [Ekhidna sp.]|uniref:S41 family peptidase n=1 Tax=Ekhidna sp. TaxID=2608089 RepID=UPI0032ED7F06